MPRTATADRRSPSPSEQSASRAGSSTDPKAQDGGHRETIESIVVAFILALVFRGFLAEAFVIPTGSMAPTLMGRHKDVTCPQCGARYRVNAADETRAGGGRVAYGTCFNCRYRTRVDEEPSFNGDRILVMKLPYQMPRLPLASPPERWDVVVFHYPEAPQQNYIKRLVGLPDEQLMIRGGDLFARPSGSDEPFAILRKPPRHLRAMLRTVSDDRHRAAALRELEDWKRWRPEPGAAAAWVETEPSIYQVQAESSAPAWMRYEHRVPDPWQWEAILEGRPPAEPPKPALIDDFSSYNTNQSDRESGFPPLQEPHWVGDLALEARVEIESESGTLLLELIEAGVPHRCAIDVATGEATLTRGGKALGDPAETPIEGPGRHRIGFANVDDRLTLWVDGRRPFGDGLAYELDRDEPVLPDEADLSPVGLAAADGAEARVSDLVLKRDIYYILEPFRSDYADYVGVDQRAYLELQDLFTDPGRFAALARADEPRIFDIGSGRYMMMGDNSPRSKDSRAWGSIDTEGGSFRDDRGFFWRFESWSAIDRAAYEVPEELIVGKAFFVYWPHAKPFGPDIRLGRDFRVPFRPQFERMTWIR